MSLSPGRSKLIAVQRKLVASDHEAMRQHMPDINHGFPELQIKWRKLGEVGLTLVEREEYSRAADKPRSNLKRTDPETLAGVINSHIIPKMKTENTVVHIPVTGINFLGEGRIVNIACLLDPSLPQVERQAFTDLFDRLNGVNSYWEEFVPNISIATVDRLNAEPRVLDAYRSIVPAELRLLASRAIAQ